MLKSPLHSIFINVFFWSLEFLIHIFECNIFAPSGAPIWHLKFHENLIFVVNHCLYQHKVTHFLLASAFSSYIFFTYSIILTFFFVIVRCSFPWPFHMLLTCHCIIVVPYKQHGVGLYIFILSKNSLIFIVIYIFISLMFSIIYIFYISIVLFEWTIYSLFLIFSRVVYVYTHIYFYIYRHII